ncbi:hypothetical protein ACFQ9X_39635 [Catenulispora yoronensis]
MIDTGRRHVGEHHTARRRHEIVDPRRRLPGPEQAGHRVQDLTRPRQQLPDFVAKPFDRLRPERILGEDQRLGHVDLGLPEGLERLEGLDHTQRPGGPAQHVPQRLTHRRDRPRHPPQFLRHTGIGIHERQVFQPALDVGQVRRPRAAAGPRDHGACRRRSLHPAQRPHQQKHAEDHVRAEPLHRTDRTGGQRLADQRYGAVPPRILRPGRPGDQPTADQHPQDRAAAAPVRIPGRQAAVRLVERVDRLAQIRLRGRRRDPGPLMQVRAHLPQLVQRPGPVRSGQLRQLGTQPGTAGQHLVGHV